MLLPMLTWLLDLQVKCMSKLSLIDKSNVCFVDTGANSSLIDYDTYLRLTAWNIEMTPCDLMIYWGDICKVNRNRILGVVNVGMRFNEKGKLLPFEFNVVENSEVMKSLKCNIVIVGDNFSKYKPVVDLRSVNQLIQPDSYPIKTLSEIFRQLDSKMLISKLDLNLGFHQIPMNDADCRYFGIMKENKVYEYTVIPQGMRNATQSFQRFIDLILGDEENIICYVDDTLVFTKNDPEIHYDALSRIINKLLSYDLSLNLTKSVFCAEKLEYLGHVVTQEGKKMRGVAIQGVVNKNYSVDKKAMRQFYDVISWYKEFIRDFSIVTAPLTDQLAKNAKVVETPESSKAFADLKSLMLSAPILQFPNYKGEVKFFLECDASCSGFELQSIILALKRFYCYTSDYLTIVYTDYKPLLNIIKDTNHPVLQRWIFYIQDRNIQIRYKPGRLNTTADYLSRCEENDACLTMCAITKREDLMFMVKSFLKDGKKEEVNPYVKHLANNSIMEPDETLYWMINLINRLAFKVP
uniref:Reverse transcriptase domain-containing protein n=1 Tax=Strongyloides venezuelensis TaxID=75913 RepID=A0A0K0FHX9_STRVS